MTHQLQLLQVILFGITPLSLIALGIILLLKPLCFINRRWTLLVYYPLILANFLAFLETKLAVETNLLTDWRFWLLLLVDFALMAGIPRLFQGYVVYGLTIQDVEALIKQTFQNQGLDVTSHTGTKHLPLRQTRSGIVLTVKNGQADVSLWIMEHMNEVVVTFETKTARRTFKSILPVLQRIEKQADVQVRAMGILYIILGVVFASMSWVLFFEPRLILVD